MARPHVALIGCRILLCAVSMPAWAGAAPPADPLKLPVPGQAALRFLTANHLELQLVQHRSSWDGPARPPLAIESPDNQLHLPNPKEFVIELDGKPVSIEAVGIRREPIFADEREFDLLILTRLFFRLSNLVSSGSEVVLSDPRDLLKNFGGPWTAKWDLKTASPAIHISPFGYAPQAPKFATFGYFLGTLGELLLPPPQTASLVTENGETILQADWRPRPEEGWKWHQNVWMLDFSSLTQPGKFFLDVPGVGRAGPILIHSAAPAVATRLLASGLYNQRSGTTKGPPWTRTDHPASHLKAASIPDGTQEFSRTWKHIAAMTKKNTPKSQSAPRITGPETLLYPFFRTGRVDVSGGHYDAGDYSKYTINSAQMIHHLVLAADHFPGASSQDELGIPESGDGVSDVLQMARHEAEFLLKMQDTDGGFYFLSPPEQK